MIMTAMRVTMVMMARRRHSHEVNGQSHRADDEQLARVHFGRTEEPLDRLKDDKDRDEAKKEAVRKARQSLDSRIPVSGQGYQQDENRLLRRKGG